MLSANGVLRGRGHRDGPDTVDAWVNIVAPSGWTQAKTEVLRKITAKGWTR